MYLLQDVKTSQIFNQNQISKVALFNFAALYNLYINSFAQYIY